MGDSVASKPSFREAFMHRRGLMPADLFYEWQVVAGRKVKQPWCVRLPGDEPFSFGALWERWTPRSKPDADALITCAIVTTEANALMAPIHHRMPLIIAADDYAVWLDPRTPQAIAQSLIRPYAGRLQAWPVSTRVNSARNNDEACIAPLP